MTTAILIHGPTASGKTPLAIALAGTLGGEIINADSMQVYQDLNILTARPTETDMAKAPHHLFGHVDAATRYSTGAWLKEAQARIDDIKTRGKIPIIVGGTGLYLLTLTEGLAQIPPVPEDIRADVRKIMQEEGGAGLKERLFKVDPASAERLNKGDRQRLSRAYEVWLATGLPFSSFKETRSEPVLAPDTWLGITLMPPRTKVYARIDRRFKAMLVEGAMDEVRQLAARDLDPELPVMKAHGMPWLSAYIRGEIDADMAANYASRDTRRYAKRQYTWISRQFPFWPRIPGEDLEKRKKVILALYREIDAVH